MNKFLLALVFISFYSVKIYAQLGNVNIVSYPCFLAPGVTGTVIADSVPGATYYEWVSNIGHINAVWFPSAPGPVQTTIPSVNILANLALPVYEICVRAINATDTSAWTCVQIMGVLDPPVLLTSNNPVGMPGDSGYYEVVLPPLCPPAGYTWTITGDATFNNGGQTIMGGSGVNINFGPNFTSGILCVNGFTNFGLPSDTVCMVITAPVGIDELYSNFSFISEHEKVIVEFSASINEVISVRFFDITGKQLSADVSTINSDNNRLEFSTAHLGQGIYFLELEGKSISKQFKFVTFE